MKKVRTGDNQVKSVRISRSKGYEKCNSGVE